LLTNNKNALAWATLMAAIGLHVFDETLTDFLPFYNGVVLELRQRLGFFPMPTFSFPLWLGGLIFLVTVGFCFTPIIAKGGNWLRIIAIILGILMILNALNHMLGSVYLGRILPGFWSSPLLLAASIFVVLRGLKKASWQKTRQLG